MGAYRRAANLKHLIRQRELYGFVKNNLEIVFKQGLN